MLLPRQERHNKEMKKTCILANGRTGSSFLINHFKSIDKYSYSCGEIFNYYIPYHFKVMHRVFSDNGLPLPKSHREFLWRLAESVQGSTKRHMQEKPWFDYQPYAMDMFDSIVKTLFNLNYKYFFCKIVPTYHRPYTIAEFFPDIIDSCDTIIVLYRKLLIDIHSSVERSMISGQWVGGEVYDPKHDAPVEWNLKDYEARVNACKNIYRDYFSLLKTKNRNYHLLEYSQITKNDASSFLKNIDENYPIQVSPIVKQTRPRKNQEDNFKNKEDFLKDLPHIETEFNIEEATS